MKKTRKIATLLPAFLMILGIVLMAYGMHNNFLSSVASKPKTEYVTAPIMVHPPTKQTVVQASVIAPQPVKMEIIELTENNTIVMDQAFDDQSVTKVMLEIRALSERQPKDATFYLVMKTPGGSVDAGLRLISFVKALPQRVKTLTLFSASMGFQTVQGLDERLILDTGTLMSHRAKFGVSGEAPGELFSRLRWIMASLDRLDQIASQRMGMSFEAYRDLIKDEYWVDGEMAVKDKAADRTVLARCGKGLSGTTDRTVDTFFGPVVLEVSKCPLIPGYISIKGRGKRVDDKTLNYVTSMFSNRNQFVRDYILTNKYLDFQK